MGTAFPLADPSTSGQLPGTGNRLTPVSCLMIYTPVPVIAAAAFLLSL